MHKNRLIHWLLGLIMALLGVSAGRAIAQDLAALQKEFQDLPESVRQMTGPLFWLHGDESEAKLREYVRIVAAGGNGCFTCESRPHNDWLGEGWFRDLAICLDEAKKNNLKMWIFDEKWWPSQGVAGKVPPQYATKMMKSQAVELTGPLQYHSDGYAGDRYIAAIAGRITADGKIDGESLIDLAPMIRGGKLDWQVPAGSWRVMKFTHVQGPPLGQNGQLSVDGASKECVDWFIQTVYQPHYDRFKADFGTWIPGFFYDEPETRGDWGADLNTTLAEWGVDWKKAYVAYQFELSGEEQAAAKFQYLDAFAETWGRTMYGGITDWCRQHKVVSIGHFMEHGSLYKNPMFCAGDMMRLQKYSGMGGIDAVFRQFAMGKRKANDVPSWQTPKLGSSISHVFGKPDDLAMVEIFGARGQDLTYPEMKWWTNHMQVSGINFHIPHSFNPRSPYDTDCPPYFYNSGQEPRWPLYRVYADYTSRLSGMLSGGRHVCPVALLFPGNTHRVGKAVMPEGLSEALQDALYDCDWMPFEVFEKDVQLDRTELTLYRERYRVLIVPPVEVIPYATLAKAKTFFDRGGVVVGYGFLPSRSATIGKNRAEIAALCQAIWGTATPGLGVCKTSPAGGRSLLLPEQPTPQQLQQALTGAAGLHPTLEVVEGTTDNWLHVLHRVKAGRDVFLVCNQNADEAARRFRFRVTAGGFPECWDAMTGAVTAVPFVRQGKSVELSLTLEPLESVLLVFAATDRKLPGRIESVKQPASVVAVKRTLMARPAAVASPDDAERDPLLGCQWVWLPGVDAASAAAPGVCYFRRQFDIPAGRKPVMARFVGTADNELALYLNGMAVGGDDSALAAWERVSDIDLTAQLRPGANTLALAVTNGTDKPNPAGLIGKILLTFKDDSQQCIPIDAAWRTSGEQIEGWETPGFNDRNWAKANAFVEYGAGPWNRINARRQTYSPVAQADPFAGEVSLPASFLAKSGRIVLEMGDIPTETAARVTVNGQYAGGCIGKPLYLDITRYVQAGANRLVIEPFAPGSVQVAFYPDASAGRQDRGESSRKTRVSRPSRSR